MLIFIEVQRFFFLFFISTDNIFSTVFSPFGAFGEVSPILLQRQAINQYFLYLNQAGSLACSCVLASINSVSLGVTLSPCINLSF